MFAIYSRNYFFNHMDFNTQSYLYINKMYSHVKTSFRYFSNNTSRRNSKK